MEKYGLYNTEPVIRTYTGKWFNVFEPKSEDICIEDIAHALSNQSRFGGHTSTFYSVAQHSVACYLMAEPEHQMAALMHDASEAYLLDIPRPIKKKLAEYHGMEDNLMKLIAEKFGFQWPLDESIKRIDECALKNEWDTFMVKTNVFIRAKTSKQSEKDFLRIFKLLTQP